MYTVSVVMEANGLRCDVRVKSVLVEHHSSTSEMSNVEVVREGRVLKVLNRFLKRRSRAIFPQCVLQWHLLCLVDAPDSSSIC